jgi:DnaJ-class molecular chaperone
MPKPKTHLETEECPTCLGQGAKLIKESNDQYDHTWLDWEECTTCGGQGFIEIEPEDDEQ